MCALESRPSDFVLVLGTNRGGLTLAEATEFDSTTTTEYTLHLFLSPFYIVHVYVESGKVRGAGEGERWFRALDIRKKGPEEDYSVTDPENQKGKQKVQCWNG